MVTYRAVKGAPGVDLLNPSMAMLSNYQMRERFGSQAKSCRRE